VSAAVPAAPDRLPPTVKGLSLVSLANDFASEMVYPLLPAFVTTTLGGGAAALGALVGAADVASAALKWWSGRRADRPGWRRPLILGGYAVAALVRPVIAVAGAAWQVVAFRVLDRVGKGLRTPARDAILADATPRGLHGRAFGFHRAADHAGAVLGSLAAWGFLHRGADVREVIGWSWVPGVLVMLALLVVLRGAPRAALGGAARAPAAGRDAAPGGAGAVSAPVLLLALFALVRLPEALFLLRLQDLGVALPAIPLVWAALHVVRSVGAYPGGMLADRVGPRALVAAGGLLFAAVSAVFATALAPGVAMAGFLVFGLVAGCTEPAERALVVRLAPAGTGRGFGAYHALTGLAALPAGLLFGAVYQWRGGPAALALSAALLAAVVAVWLVASPRVRA